MGMQRWAMVWIVFGSILLGAEVQAAESALAKTYIDTGLTQQKANNHEEAVRTFATAFQEAERSNDVLRMALSKGLRGNSLMRLERWPEAQKDLEFALQTSKKAFSDPEHGVIVEIADDLALTYARQDKKSSSELYYRWLLPIYEKATPRDDAVVLQTIRNLAIVTEGQKKYSDAAGFYQRLVDEKTKSVGRTHAETQTALIDLAECYRKSGNSEALNKIAEELKAEVGKARSTEVPAYISLQRSLASTAASEQNREDAVQILEGLLPSLEGSFGKIIDARTEVLSDLGDHYLNLDRLDDALRVYREQVKLLTEEHGAKNKKTLDAMYSLAWACYRSKAYEEGVEFGKKSRDGYITTLGPEDVNVAHVERVLGHIARGREDWESAAEHYRVAGSIYRQQGKESTKNAVNSLNDLSSVLIKLDRAAEARRALEQALAVREASYGVDSIEAAKGLSELAWFHRSQGDLVTAQRLLEESISRSEVAVGKDSPELSPFLSGLASLHRAQGKNDLAEELLTRNLRNLEARGNTTELKKALSDLANLLEELGRYQDAEKYARRAVTVAEAVHGVTQPETASEKRQLAWILMRLDRWDDGQRMALAAVDVLERAGSDWESQLASAYNTVHGCMDELNDIHGAERYLRKAISIEERLDYNGAAAYIYNLGNLVSSLGKRDEAEKLYRDALSRLDRKEIEDPPKTEVSRLHYANSRIRNLKALAGLCQSLERLDEAETLLRQAMALQEQNFDEDHVGMIYGLRSLSELLIARDRHEERIPLIEREHKIVEKTVAPVHTDRANALHDLAGVRDQQGRLREAEDLYRSSVEMAEQVYGRGQPQLISYYSGLFDCLLEAGRVDEVRSLAGRARDLQSKLLSDDYNQATVLAMQGAASRSEGDFRTALKRQREILSFMQSHAKARPRDIASRQVSIADTAIQLGDLPTARTMLESARRFYGEHPPHRMTLAWFTSVEADYARAAEQADHEEKLRRQVVDLRRQTPQVYPQTLISHELTLARCLADRSRLEEAKLVLQAAQTRLESQIDVLPPLKIYADQIAGYLRLRDGQGDAALVLVQAAYDRQLALNGADHPDTGEILRLLALVQSQVGQHAPAVEMARKNVAIQRDALVNGAPEMVRALQALLDCQSAAEDSGADATRKDLAAARATYQTLLGDAATTRSSE